MALGHGPTVVTNGLVLALDAADRNSFDDDENLMTNSQLGNAILNDGSGVTLTTDITIANPFDAYDGVLKCVHTTNTPGYFRRGQNMSLTAGVTYTFSFFFKNGTVVNPYGQPPINIGVLASTYSPTFQSIEASLNTNIPFLNGWYRQVFTFTPSYTQTYQVNFNQANNQSLLGTYYLYGFQLETGSSASPYYATTSTAKNRGTILTDLTGRGNNGTLTNSPTYNSSNSGSIVFDGVDDYVNLSKTSQFNFGTNDFTIQTFCNLTSKNTNYPCIFGNYLSYSAGAIYFGFDHDAAPTKYTIWVNGQGSPTLTSSTNVIYGSWTQLTVVRSSGVGYFYINNSLDGTPASMSASLNGDGSLLSIGRALDSTSTHMRGYISNFKIYNRALTAAEIQQNFNALRRRFGI